MTIDAAINILNEHISMIDKDIEQCIENENYEGCVELKNIKKGLQFAVEDIST